MDRTDQNKPLTSREKGSAFREYDRDSNQPDYSSLLYSLSVQSGSGFSRIRDVFSHYGIETLSNTREEDLEGLDNLTIEWIFTDLTGQEHTLIFPLPTTTDFNDLKIRFGDEVYNNQIISIHDALKNFLAIEVALRRFFIHKFGESNLRRDKFDKAYLLRPTIIVQQTLFLLFDGRILEAENFLEQILACRDTNSIYNIIKSLPRFDLEHPKHPRFSANLYYHSTRSALDEILDGLGKSERALNLNTGSEWDINHKYVEGQYNHAVLVPHTTMVFSKELIQLYCYLFGSLSGGWGGEVEVSIRVPKNLRIPWKDVAVRISEYKK